MKTKLRFPSWLLPVVPLLLVFTVRVQAANQIVSNLGDTGLASQLRQKINACQSGASPGGTITFSVAGTVTLDSAKGPLPTSVSNVVIDAGSKVQISGNNAIHIFNVTTGATLTLKNVTISHANSQNGDGGAVASTGTVNAENTKFLYNQTSASWSGSAILCWGPLTITNSEFAFNTGGGARSSHGHQTQLPLSATAISTIIRQPTA